MAALGVSAVVYWAKIGNVQLRQNWEQGRASSGADITRQLFYGFCLGMLGLTGIECALTLNIADNPQCLNYASRYAVVHWADQARAPSTCAAKPPSPCNRAQHLIDHPSASYRPANNLVGSRGCPQCTCTGGAFSIKLRGFPTNRYFSPPVNGCGGGSWLTRLWFCVEAF
jgi:hypothetical protein